MRLPISGQCQLFESPKNIRKPKGFFGDFRGGKKWEHSREMG